MPWFHEQFTACNALQFLVQSQQTFQLDGTVVVHGCNVFASRMFSVTLKSLQLLHTDCTALHATNCTWNHGIIKPVIGSNFLLQFLQLLYTRCRRRCCGNCPILRNTTRDASTQKLSLDWGVGEGGSRTPGTPLASPISTHRTKTRQQQCTDTNSVRHTTTATTVNWQSTTHIFTAS